MRLMSAPAIAGTLSAIALSASVLMATPGFAGTPVFDLPRLDFGKPAEQTTRACTDATRIAPVARCR